MRKEVVVYLDEVFLLNLGMDFLLLLFTARIARTPMPLRRIIFGSLFGALYIFTVFLPPLSFVMTLLLKLFLSLAIIFVTFAPITIPRYLRLLVLFYGISFFVGGLVFAAVNLFEGSPFIYNGIIALKARTFFPILLVSSLAVILLGKLCMRYYGRVKLEEALHYPLVISLDGYEVEMEAMVDTGNDLRDPFTKKPVIVVEYGAVAELFPPEVNRIILNAKDRMRALGWIGEPWILRFSLIPYNSIGKKHGVLLGFRPDRIEIVEGEGRNELSDAILGLVFRPLKKEGSCRALLHPELVTRWAG